MLHAKESYYNQMYALQQLQQYYEEASISLFGTVALKRDDLASTGIQDKKLQEQKMKTDIAQNEYQRCLDKLNLTIDVF